MKIGITGGIGSGKTFVCQRLQARGFEVFDCDNAAKKLMRTSVSMRQKLTELIGPGTYDDDGRLNKAQVSRFLLSSSQNAKAIDAIVHPAVFDAFRESGCSYRVLEDRGYMMPVVSMSIQYKKPAFYDDLVTIKVIVREKPGVKMKFEYEAYNEQGELLNYGDTVLCFVNKATGRPCMAPDFFMDVIGKFF